MNSGVFMKSLDIFFIHVILNLWIGGHSQQTIYNWIANNEWSGAGFPKLRLPGPCEQVFGFSRSLCSCGSFLLPCSHGFRQSLSRSRKGGLLPAGTNKAPGIHERQWPSRAFGSVCWGYHKLYLSRAFCREHPAWIAVYGGFARFAVRRRCSFGRCAAVRIAACRQVNEVRFSDCESASPVFCKMWNFQMGDRFVMSVLHGYNG